MEPQHANIASNKFAVGAYGVLGMDVVSFSTLDEGTQIMVIQRLMRYVKESVLFHSLTEADFRWSPAGDGGYLTFVNPQAGRAAIDVAFSIFDKVRASGKRASTERFRIRAALHAGCVREDEDLSRETNIWGMGIYTTARILSVSDEDRMLVSKQYYDTYIKDQREGEFNFGEPHWRTVKHGVNVRIHCSTGAVLDIGAEGRFDHLPVVGISSAIGKPDGDVAEVLEDTVAVRISHEILAELRRAYPGIKLAWSGLCGARLQEAK